MSFHGEGVISRRPHRFFTTSLFLVYLTLMFFPRRLALAEAGRPGVQWPQKVSSVVIPSRFTEAGRVDIKVEIPQTTKPFWCVLDTGAGKSTLQDGGVDLSLKMLGELSASGVGNNQMQVADMPNIRLGGLVLTNRKWGWFKGSPMNHDGLAGTDVFRSAVWEVSYAQQEVRAFPFGEYVPPLDAIVWDLELVLNIPVVTATVNGVPGVRLQWDSGCGVPLALFRSLVTTHGWKEQAGHGAMGIGGREETGLVKLTGVTVGVLGFTGVHAMVVKGYEGPDVFDGHLGPSLFMGEVTGWAVDYQRKKMYLYPKPGGTLSPKR